MDSLAIIGAGGHGKVVADAAVASGWKTVSFFDDCVEQVTSNPHWSVLGTIEDYFSKSFNFNGVIVALGENETRQQIINRVINSQIQLTTIIHPNSNISAYADIGPGTAVLANAVINIGVKIGMGCIINSAAVIEHDCLISDAVHVSPAAVILGNVVIEEASWIGAGSVVKNNLRIGKKVVVGAGSVVLKNVEDSKTVFGNPTR